MAKKKTARKRQQSKRKQSNQRKGMKIARIGDFECTITKVDTRKGYGIVKANNSKIEGKFQLSWIKGFTPKIGMTVRATIRRKSNRRNGIAQNLAIA